MKNSILENVGKQVMKVYAARDYDLKNPRLTKYVEVNLPEYTPTIPRDNQFENIGLSGNFFVNQNFPVNDATIKSTHFLSLPLLGGTDCPVYFKKDTPFLLFTPTSRMEDGYLLYI